jgi:2'-5' RNA ligase
MKHRLFIAVDTPAEIRVKMAELQSKLRESGADVRWEPQEKFHATVKFLGNVEESLLPKIISTIEQSTSAFSRFIITYSRLGCFPHVHRPRVIWIGCENTDGTLKQIKETLDTLLLPFGFEREEREFHPHITIGRVKSMKNIKSLIPILQSLTFEPHTSTCKEILLMKSVLKTQGSEYSMIHAFLLG